MRRSVLLSLLLLSAGCVSNSSSPVGAEDAAVPGEDSGFPPGPDATVPLDSGIDAAHPDASSVPDSALTADGAPADTGADAAPPPVTLLITNDLGPEPGVLVLFHDSTGAFTGNATTGAHGMVSAQLPADSQVTAVLQGPNGMGLVTIQGVQPGDALTAFDGVNLAVPSSMVTIDAVPDGGPPDGGSYKAYAGACYGSSTTVPFSMDGVMYPCELGGQFPVLLLAASPTDGAEIAYSYAKGNPLPPDGGGAEVAVAVPWATDESTASVFVANTPSSLNDAGLGESPNVSVCYGELAGDVAYTQVKSPGSDDDGGLVASFTGHPQYPEAVQAEGTMRSTIYPDDQAGPFGTIVAVAMRSGPPDGSAQTIDLSQLLPQVTASAIDTTEAGTPARPVVTWTSVASLAATDGIVMQTTFSLSFPDGGSSKNFPWIVVSPPTATSVTPPALPASLGVPAAVILEYEPPLVMAVEASYISGYAQLRQDFASLAPTSGLVDYYSNAAVAPTLPVDGTLRLTAVTASGD